MFDRLIEYHFGESAYKVDREIASAFSLIGGVIISVFSIMFAIVKYDFGICLRWYLIILGCMYVLTGLSSYSSNGNRKSAIIMSFLWPLLPASISTFWAGYGLFFVMKNFFKGIVTVHNAIFTAHRKINKIKLLRIKLPKLPKKKVRVAVPQEGAYRSAPETCPTCGKFMNDPIHKHLLSDLDETSRIQGTYSRGPG